MTSLPLLRNAVLGVLLSSVLFGLLGPLLTVQRMLSLAGAVSHAVLGGIGLALLVSAVLIPGFPPMAGALVFALLSALVVAKVSRAGQRAETAINAVWAVGMSVGVLALAKTPGYADASSYLFGNILLVTALDLWLLLGLAVLTLVLVGRFYGVLQLTAFDAEYARTRGVPVERMVLLLLVITSVAIVLLQTFVGVVMMIAMFALPTGIAAGRARTLRGMMTASVVLSALFGLLGLGVGWLLDLPPGSVAVVGAGAVFLAVSLARRSV